MALHIVIERPNGYVTLVRSKLETASDDPLTEYEKIINELFQKVKELTNTKRHIDDNTEVIKPGEKICDCPECKAEIINGFTDKTMELMKRSRLLRHIEMPDNNEIVAYLKMEDKTLSEKYHIMIGIMWALAEVKRRNEL